MALDELVDSLLRHDARAAELVQALSGALKAAAKDPRHWLQVRVAARSLLNGGKQAEVVAEEICAHFGFTLADVDRVLEGEIPVADEFQRLDKRDAIAIEPTEFLDERLPEALERLLSDVSPKWLEAESKKPFRLSVAEGRSTLGVVGARRIAPLDDPEPPQRFARALLLCKDHLEKHPDLDFWELPILATEVAMLGLHLDALPDLGACAVEKYRRLPQMSDELVASTVYELIVGLAGIKNGLELQMLEEGASKTPEYRVHNFRIPTVIECKRKRTCGQLRRESAHAHHLFAALVKWLERERTRARISVDFVADVKTVSEKDFLAAAIPLVEKYDDEAFVEEAWGTVRFRRTPYTSKFETTRLFAPNYLKAIFDWDDAEWDGGFFLVESPRGILVQSARDPTCLLWRCRSESSMAKKARGLASVFGKAIKQLPDGEMGIVYLCYEELGCEQVADRRTQLVIREIENWRHRATVNIPLVVVSRLYPRPLGAGIPDLVESSLPITSESMGEVILKHFPSNVFAPDL